MSLASLGEAAQAALKEIEHLGEWLVDPAYSLLTDIISVSLRAPQGGEIRWTTFLTCARLVCPPTDRYGIFLACFFPSALAFLGGGLLCFKCLKNIPDKSARCPHCGQNFAGKSAANANTDRGLPLKEGDKVGQYQVRELVGEGPMGRVYKVLDTQFDVLAALKILYPEFSKDR
ncbi:MAG: hypothetical protein H0X11_13175, partial [Betaproteobacteria bacterium]|nr:hypothetical protein [Betaproteobacteria bacterium]